MRALKANMWWSIGALLGVVALLAMLYGYVRARLRLASLGYVKTQLGAWDLVMLGLRGDSVSDAEVARLVLG